MLVVVKKTIYHGSPNILKQPQFGLGKVRNDYGLGFYCTESEEMAKEWSVAEDHDGFANRYEIETDGLSVLMLNAPDFTILHWLSMLLENRVFTTTSELATEAKAYVLETFKVDYASADVIYGYRADDSYFSFAQDFLNGTISVEKLNRAMQLGNLGMQYVLKSRKAFSQLAFVDAERVPRDEWYARRMSRDTRARQDYFDSRRKRTPGQLYITEILDNGIQPHDARLRQALS